MRMNYEWILIRKCSGLCFITQIQRKKGKIADFEITPIIHNLHQRLCQSPGSKTTPCLPPSHHPMLLTCISLLAKKQAKKWSSKRKKFITSFSRLPEGEKGFTEVFGLPKMSRSLGAVCEWQVPHIEQIRHFWRTLNREVPSAGKVVKLCKPLIHRTNKHKINPKSMICRQKLHFQLRKKIYDLRKADITPNA